jgi:hypothetical protein
MDRASTLCTLLGSMRDAYLPYAPNPLHGTVHLLTFANFVHELLVNITSAGPCSMGSTAHTQETTYVESWPNTTSAWAGWRRFDIPVDRYDGVHSLLQCKRVFNLYIG